MLVAPVARKARSPSDSTSSGALRAREATRARPGREVEALAEALLDNGRELPLGNVAQARQVLERLLRSRVTFRRESRGDVDGYWFEGEGTVKALVPGVFPRAQAVASPSRPEDLWTTPIKVLVLRSLMTQVNKMRAAVRVVPASGELDKGWHAALS